MIGGCIFETLKLQSLQTRVGQFEHYLHEIRSSALFIMYYGTETAKLFYKITLCITHKHTLVVIIRRASR